MIFVAYFVGKVKNMQLGSIIIMGEYYVGKLHNMIPWYYYDNGSILCRQGTQYATLLVLL